jgi:hypothetical protein
MPATLLPSAEVVTVTWLKANADLLAIHGGRVGTKLNATLPAIRAQRIGGTPESPQVDEPLLQVEAWAADQVTADLLARTIVAVLPTIRGAVTGGKVYTYSIESGPFWSPDDPNLSSNARYIITVRLLTSH